MSVGAVRILPDCHLVVSQNLSSEMLSIVQRKKLLVRQHANLFIRELRQLTADHERSSEHVPERQHRTDLCGCKGRTTLFAEGLSDHTDREHIAVRIAAAGHMILPLLAAAEHVQKKRPAVPEVIGNPPHVCILCIEPCTINVCRSRRKRQDDRPARLQNGAVNHLGLMPSGKLLHLTAVRVLSGIADIITFDKINSPVRIHLNQRIVICLSCRNVPNTVHIRIPRADRIRIRDLIRRHIRSEHRKMPEGCRSRNSAHDMNTELQTQTVDISRKLRKALSACCRREPVFRRLKPSVLIHRVVSKRNVLNFRPFRPRISGIPLNVDDHILVSRRLQMICKILRVGLYLRFRHRGVVIIIAVPPLRRGHRKAVLVHFPSFCRGFSTATYRHVIIGMLK